jgi:hypothetical protein
MKKTIKTKIVEVVENLAFELNDEKTRRIIREKIEPIVGFPLEDFTTNEDADSGFIVFRGFNPETKKSISLTIKTHYELSYLL